jgi:transposase-like protein
VASAPTLCRLKKWAGRATAKRLHEVLVDQLIASLKSAPEELVLDFDAADNPPHGQQEGRFFNGYYDCYCYLSLHEFCGQQLPCAYLRPSRIDGARHAGAIPEPPRVLRRLFSLRGLSHEQEVKQVFTRGTRRAVRMVQEHRGEYPSLWARHRIHRPQDRLRAQTLNEWVKRDQIDTGVREGITTSELQRLKELERENKELRKANEILKLASAFFAQAELDRRLKS